MNTKREIVQGLSLKALIVGLIAVFIFSFFASYPWWLRWGCYAVFGDMMWVNWLNMIYFSAMFGMAFAFIIIIAVINQIKHWFSKTEVAIITIMILMSGAYFNSGSTDWKPSFFSTITGMPVMFGAQDVYTPEQITQWYSILPGILSIPEGQEWFQSILYAETFPNYSVNWGIVLPNMIWGVLFFSSLVLAFVFFLQLFRRLWMDVEYLQFPMADIASTLIDSTEPESGVVKLFKNKLFWIGFLIQFVWLIIPTIDYWMAGGWFGPWLPAIGNTRSFPFGYLSPYAEVEHIVGPTRGIWPYPVSDFSAFVGIMAPLVLSLEPRLIGWCNILSVDVLIGIIVMWVAVGVIYPAILTPIQGPPPGPIWFSTRIDNIQAHSYPSGVGVNTEAIGFGMLIGMAIVPIIMNRQAIVPMLTALIKEPPKEADPDRPLPYRMIWLIFLALLVLTTVLGVAIGLDPIIFLVWFLAMLFFTIGAVRTYAESGGSWGMLVAGISNGAGYGYLLSSVLLMVFNGIYTSQQLTQSNVMSIIWLAEWAPMGMALATMLPLFGTVGLDAQKIAKNAGLSLKTSLKAVVVALVFTAIVASGSNWFIAQYLPRYRYTTPGGNWWLPQILSESVGAAITSIEAGELSSAMGNGQITGRMANIELFSGDFIIKIIAGLAVVLIIPFLRIRFSWFRVSAAGIVIGTLFGHWMWSGALVALIIKLVLQRTGETQKYTEKLRMLSIGMIMGWVLLFLFTDVFLPAFHWETLRINELAAAS